MTFEGKEGARVYQAIALKSALKLYAKTGIKPNKAWTPTAMMVLARAITGKHLGPRDYMGAAEALQVWLDERLVPSPPSETEES